MPHAIHYLLCDSDINVSQQNKLFAYRHTTYLPLPILLFKNVNNIAVSSATMILNLVRGILTFDALEFLLSSCLPHSILFSPHSASLRILTFHIGHSMTFHFSN